MTIDCEIEADLLTGPVQPMTQIRRHKKIGRVSYALKAVSIHLDHLNLAFTENPQYLPLIPIDPQPRDTSNGSGFFQEIVV